MNSILNTEIYNRLYYDFLEGSSPVQNFLPDFKAVNWTEIGQSVLDQSEVYGEVKNLIINQNSDLNSPKANEYKNYLKEKNTVFIVTGQQLGLLASPLYTIYKIITAIKLSEKLNSEINGIKHVPLFWLESEDHDFDEINHFGIWNKNFVPKTITYQGENRGKISIKHYEFESKIEDLKNLLKDELISTEFTTDLFSKIDLCYKSGKSWLVATRELLKYVFKEQGVLFFRPGDAEIKKLSVPFFKNIINHSVLLNDQFKRTSIELEKNGYHNQVTVVDGKTFLFTENDDLQREHVYFENNTFYTKESELRFDKSQLLNFIEASPDRISSSVVSRPLLQSFLIPTVAYVAGPGEIAYWAQISDMFDQIKLEMPIVYPRISATLLEPKIQRYIRKYDVDIEYFPEKKEEFVNTFLAQQSDFSFQDSKKNIINVFEDMQKEIINIDPTLKAVVEKTSNKVLGQIDFLEHKTLKAKEQKEKNLVSQINQIHAAFFPDGYPQERYLTFVYFLNKFGLDILNQFYEKLRLENYEHQIIDL